jgi:hypothetical protein
MAPGLLEWHGLVPGFDLGALTRDTSPEGDRIRPQPARPRRRAMGAAGDAPRSASMSFRFGSAIAPRGR